MKDDTTVGIIIILLIIGLALFGGFKNSKSGGLFSFGQPEVKSQTQSEADIKKQIVQARQQVDDLEKEIQLLSDQKTRSKYYGLVDIRYVNRSATPSQEYTLLSMGRKATTTIEITGWTLKSLSSGNVVQIPKGTYLIFPASINTEDPIILSGGDMVYITTGMSPNGYSFKVNKCSGYMTQFQTYIPYLYTNCPAPRNEDTSSIPNIVSNDKCFDYIEKAPMCRVQSPQPAGLSFECQKFIESKIGYGACINTHKNDSDFYLPEWRVYLKRSNRLWKDRRETIVLYDNDGKVVDTLTY